jgi:hypothetical protein
MGADRDTEARKQSLYSLSTSSDPRSMLKSLGLMFLLTCRIIFSPNGRQALGRNFCHIYIEPCKLDKAINGDTIKCRMNLLRKANQVITTW